MNRRERLLRAFAWFAPALLAAALYHIIFGIWFCFDDFAWLGQAIGVSGFRNWLEILFTPRAQGTIRPLTERLYFIVLHGWFGLDPLPFRIVAFATLLANLTLLQSITLRLTRTRWAAALAPMVWTMSIGLATPMSWASTYNQLLCACFLLGGLRLLIAALETGRRRYWILHWIVFLLGFGALEIQVVYPALAALYVLLYARQRWRVLPPMVAVSIAYALFHRFVAEHDVPAIYQQHWDLSIFRTLWTGISTALAGGYTPPRFHLPPNAWKTVARGLALSAGCYLAWAGWRRQWRVLVMALGWFLIAIAPVLPVRDHFSEYYIGIPAIGIAWLAAFALEDAWQRRKLWGSAVAMLVLVHVVWSAFTVRATLRWREALAAQVQMLVEGVARAKELHPEQTILLDGVDSSLFWAAVYDKPFRLVGANEVLLAPSEEKSIEAHPELGDIAPFVMPRGVAAKALERNLVVVYRIEPPLLRNVTREWRHRAREWPLEAPREVDAGLAVFDDQMGEGWYSRESGYRWMGRSAEVRLAGPPAAGMRLILKGFVPPDATRRQPLHLTVSVAGVRIGDSEIVSAQSDFELRFPLPAELVGRQEIKVRLEVDRTLRPANDARDLGLAFGTFSIR